MDTRIKSLSQVPFSPAPLLFIYKSRSDFTTLKKSFISFDLSLLPCVAKFLFSRAHYMGKFQRGRPGREKSPIT